MATTQPREKPRLEQRRLPGNKTPTKVQKQDHQTPGDHRHPQHHRDNPPTNKGGNPSGDDPGRNGNHIRQRPQITEPPQK